MNTSRRIRLRDIADRLGLSTSTVSLALRNHPRIPEETTRRVMAEAQALGYIYNRAAADLRRSHSDVIAVCLNDLSNPVFNEFLTHIEDELRQQGRTVFLGVAREDRALQSVFIRSALEYGVSGLLLCPCHGTTAGDLAAALPAHLARHFPCIAFSRAIEGARIPQFVNDDLEAGRLAARHLLEAGHRRICWLGGGQSTSTARGRQQGFVETLRAAGVPAPIICHGPTSRAFGHEAASRLLAGTKPPDAFACFSDLIAFGVLHACHTLGLVPGRDVSVVGCDDMEEAAYANPPLSTVRVDKDAIGRGAATAFLRMQAGEPIAPETTVIAASFISRATIRQAPFR